MDLKLPARWRCRFQLREGSRAAAKPTRARATAYASADSSSPSPSANAQVTNTCGTRGGCGTRLSCVCQDCAARQPDLPGPRSHGGRRSWKMTARSMKTLPRAYATGANACQPRPSFLPREGLAFTAPATCVHELKTHKTTCRA